MKNFFKTSLYFLAFALAGIYFQISCSNSDNLETVASEEIDIINTNEKLVFVKKDFTSNNDQSIWLIDLVDLSETQIPISLPSNLEFYRVYSSGEHSTAKLSQDGQTVFFTVNEVGQSAVYIYSCNIDGTNLQEVSAFGQSTGIFL